MASGSCDAQGSPINQSGGRPWSGYEQRSLVTQGESRVLCCPCFSNFSHFALLAFGDVTSCLLGFCINFTLLLPCPCFPRFRCVESKKKQIIVFLLLPLLSSFNAVHYFPGRHSFFLVCCFHQRFLDILYVT